MALRLDPVPQVWGITGNLGGGKSLSAVCLAAYAMSRGYFVVSNISLNLDELATEFGDCVRRLYHHFSFEDGDFDPFQLPTGSPRGTRNGKRVLVIMDECAEWIDQYTSSNTNPRIKRFLSWLRHSSKRSQDVILVVQRLDYLNKNIRLLISKWVIVDDLKVWRMPIIKARLIGMGGFVMQRVFDRNKRLVQGPCIVNKAAFGRFYNTAECLNSDGAHYNTEYFVPFMNTGPWFGYVVFYILSLVALVAVVSRANIVLSRRHAVTAASIDRNAVHAAENAYTAAVGTRTHAGSGTRPDAGAARGARSASSGGPASARGGEPVRNR